MWYDNSKMLSYNKIINFVVGNRGGGKTYNAKKWCINDYIKNQKEFVWVRRYKTELKKINKFFDDIKFQYPDLELTVKGNIAYCNGNVMGYFIALSTSQRDKSVSFPNVNKIIFDEFLIAKGSLRYLPNEVDVFLELFETVARLRDNVRATFLANNITVVNPYFTYFNLKPNLNKQFNVFDNIIVEYFTDSDFIAEKQKTRFGKLISNTEYGQYSIENNALYDNDNFIAKKTNDSKFIFSIKYNKSIFGIWTSHKYGKMFVNKQYDPCSLNNFSITTDDHEPNMLYIRQFKKLRNVKDLIFAFDTGILFFEDQECKKEFIRIYSIIR